MWMANARPLKTQNGKRLTSATNRWSYLSIKTPSKNSIQTWASTWEPHTDGVSSTPSKQPPINSNRARVSLENSSPAS